MARTSQHVAGSGSAHTLIEQVQRALRRRWLAMPAAILLESLRPLDFFASELLQAAAPLAPILGREIEQVGALLGEPEPGADLSGDVTGGD